MSKKDILLTLLLVTIWGANFTIIRLGLDGLPPMLLVALRYIFAFFPIIFFVKRPAISWNYLLAYGLTVGVGQFGCLFYAISSGMPAGTASVIAQSQAFFTLLFAALFLKEPLRFFHITGIGIAIFGLFLLTNTGSDSAAAIPLGSLIFSLAGAAFWSASSILVRVAARQTEQKGEILDMFSLVVWSSLIPPLPLIGLELFMDSPETLIQALLSLNIQSAFSVLYLSYLSTLFGFGVWSYLLAKYPTAKVAPLSLLVPVTGLICANIVLNEQLLPLQWLGCLIVILGLVITNFTPLLLNSAIVRNLLLRKN